MSTKKNPQISQAFRSNTTSSKQLASENLVHKQVKRSQIFRGAEMVHMLCIKEHTVSK